MSEARMMGSLADRLLSFVSTTPERDANYDIAVTLLKHYPQLKGMTLGQIANLCYTSKASISRFCRFLGMDSFKAFQAWLEQDFTMRTDYSRQFYTMLHNNQEMAIRSYRDTLISNIYATITPENAEVIPDIVRVLHGCGKAAYFSHHFLWDIGHYFQSKMMIMGRYVELFMDYDVWFCFHKRDLSSGKRAAWIRTRQEENAACRANQKLWRCGSSGKTPHQSNRKTCRSCSRIIGRISWRRL